MGLRITVKQGLGVGLAIAAVAIGVETLKWSESYSMQAIVSQKVHDTPAEKALARSHYKTSVITGKWSFRGGLLVGSLGFLAGCIFFDFDKRKLTPEEKRQQAQLLIAEADQEEITEAVLKEMGGEIT